MAKKIVLAGACRTAIGTMGGSLSTTPAAELRSIVIKAVSYTHMTQPTTPYV